MHQILNPATHWHPKILKSTLNYGVKGARGIPTDTILGARPRGLRPFDPKGLKIHGKGLCFVAESCVNGAVTPTLFLFLSVLLPVMVYSCDG